jgi:ParB family chromosome partitioning protein
MSQLYSDSIFWVETEKINANPYQPRKEFDERALQDLADSVRQYGVLQPLVVTRREYEKEDGGLAVDYELIAGERRLRASRLAKLQQVPVIIRNEEDGKVKLELAIIENLQREDLNPIDRARAFLRLAEEFTLTHAQIGKKMGKSREYVSNSLRLLQLPQEIMEGLQAKRISEGHARTLMMLNDRPNEQSTLFKEIMYKKMSVRESEKIARSIAKDKVRKREAPRDPQIEQYQKQLAEQLGTRVQIEQGEVGGKIVIDFFSQDDIQTILGLLDGVAKDGDTSMLDKFIARQESQAAPAVSQSVEGKQESGVHNENEKSDVEQQSTNTRTSLAEVFSGTPDMDDISKPIEEGSEDLYDINNFSL